jgi:hypothetical protein
MPIDNLSAPAEPVAVPAPQSEEELISDISNLLDDPATDPVNEHEEANAAQPEDDDPLGLGAEDVVQKDDAEDPDGPDEPEIKGGRFAPDSAKVTLDDGSVISVAELKRNNLFQRDYTKHRQEDAEARKVLDSEREQVSQYAQSLEQSREYLTWYAEKFIPQQPGPFTGDARQDPQAFIEWQQDVARWQTHAQAWQQFKAEQEAEGQRKVGETQKQHQERVKRERDALMNAIPVLKDPVKGKQVWDNIVAGATQHYGIAPEEVNSTADHRFIKVLRDALAYRRIKEAAPTVQATVAKRPAVNNGRRAAPGAAQIREKQARTERLRNSGTLQDGIAALSDLDL